MTGQSLKVSRTMFTEVECPVFDSEVAQTRGELVEGQFAVYILQCSDSSFYVGHTNNLQKRLNYHNSKNGAIWTSKRLPAKLVYFFVCTEKQVLFFEKKLKGWRKNKKEKLIGGEWTLDYFKVFR